MGKLLMEDPVFNYYIINGEISNEILFHTFRNCKTFDN